MTALWVTIFTLFLTVHRLTAMHHDTNSTMMPFVNDNNTVSFLPLRPEFSNAPYKLMNECISMGYNVPQMDEAPTSDTVLENMESKPISGLQYLLSTFSHRPGAPPPTEQPNVTMESEIDWLEMTESLRGCNSLPCMIDLIQNYSDGPRCFMQAFMAPFVWMTVMTNDSEIDPKDFKLLLWAAKPFVKNMLPPELMLPPRLRPQHLSGMVKMFSEDFDSLTPMHRRQIYNWVKGQIRKSILTCNMKPTKPENSKPNQSKDPKGPPVCRDWLNATGMEMMGRFLTLLPPNEFQNINKDELCAFFRKPQFQDSFRGAIPRNLGRMMFKKVEKECFKKNSEILQHLGRFGGLACYFDKPNELNSSLSQVLLSHLKECENSESQKLKRKLAMIVLSSQGQGPPTPEFLQSLGDAATAVPVTTLEKYIPSEIKKIITSIGKVHWKLAQARVLAKKCLTEGKTPSGSELLDLGTVVQGVPSKVLWKANVAALGIDKLRTLGLRLSQLQRAAMMDGLRRKMNASELMSHAPGPLAARLSLTTLKNANITSVNQLEGKDWTRYQAAYLLKRIMGRRMKPKDIKKLKAAVQGVTCQMIDNTNQSEVQEVAQALTESMPWLSRTQMSCAAKKLYSSLQKERNDYFRNVTDAELNGIPTALLIFMPENAIMGLPDSVCPSFLDKMSQANLSTLPLSSSTRSTLTNKALACLGNDPSVLTPDNIIRLGPLVCELGPHLSSLGADALNTTLLELAKCYQIDGKHGHAIINKLKEEYGEPSSWSSSTMTTFGRLLLLDEAEVRSLTYKSWLKEVLLDVLDSLPPCLSQNAPKEFQIWPRTDPLCQKIFALTTNSTEASPAARRKRADCENPPTLAKIIDLGAENVYWSEVQLACISTDDFEKGVQTLGEIDDYSHEQLVVLRSKVIEVWGLPGSLSESQVSELGCINRGFQDTELPELNITSLDTLKILDKCSWRQEQSERIWQGYGTRRQLMVEELDSVDIMGLGQFICGLSTTELRNLSTDAFREAVADVSAVECTLSKMEVLKDKGLQVFGRTEAWTEAVVNSMGNIIAYLTGSELGSLGEPVMAFIRPSAISLILPTHLAMLSVNQLKQMGPENAAEVTDNQKAMLSRSQREALDEALGVPTTNVLQPTPAGNGASRVGIVGTLVFLQQFLFLTLWYAT